MADTVSDYYSGSRVFAGFSDYLGISVDKVNFIISQVSALFLASLFRTTFHPSKTKTAYRNVFGLVGGLIMGYICFGIRQAFHLAALPAVCYVVIRTHSPYIMQRMVLFVALLYLSAIHIHRLVYDYGSCNLDITGPLMVITQKVTSLAFSLHDGLTKKDEEMSESQKIYAVKKLPTALEYFSFTLHFTSLLAGPAIFYKDYTNFVEGSSLTISVKSEKTENQASVIEPSPLKAIAKKLCIALGCAVLFVQFLPRFPISKVKQDDFVENTSITQKFIYLYISTSLVRFKYYFAWTMADAICNNAGMGLNGVDKSGQPKWDKFTNVDIFNFEFSSNLRESIDAWNLGTNKWLRMVAYDRVDKHKLAATYFLSAIWHGFYPGYYITFANAAFFTIALRTVRKTIRNYFLANAETKFFYDAVTLVATRIFMAYMVYTFVLLEFWACIRLYTHMYWCFHLAGLFAIIVLPKVIPKTTPNQAAKISIAQAFVQARPLTNGVSRHHD